MVRYSTEIPLNPPKTRGTKNKPPASFPPFRRGVRGDGVGGIFMYLINMKTAIF